MLKKILSRNDLTQIDKNRSANLERSRRFREKMFSAGRPILVFLYRPKPPIFCLLPGSTDNTNAKYSMNFFFSLAHTENTGKRAFLIFLCHEHAWCFENLEKKSKKRVILAIWGGLKMCVYSCAQQLSQGESQGFPQTCIPHSKFYC